MVHPQDEGVVRRPLVIDPVRRYGPCLRLPAVEKSGGWTLQIAIFKFADRSVQPVQHTRGCGWIVPRDEIVDVLKISDRFWGKDQIHRWCMCDRIRCMASSSGTPCPASI